MKGFQSSNPVVAVMIMDVEAASVSISVPRTGIVILWYSVLVAM
jgi:hypothetical protein